MKYRPFKCTRKQLYHYKCEIAHNVQNKCKCITTLYFSLTEMLLRTFSVNYELYINKS